MADQFSFDIVSTVDIQEIKNSIQMSMKEIKQRFDFRDSKSEILLDEKENEITINSEDDYKLKNVNDIFQNKIIKRQINLKSLIYGNPESSFGGNVRLKIKLQMGIPMEKAKEINNFIKGVNAKVHSQIQDEQVRVFSKSKDELQKIMKAVREKDFGIPLYFRNYR